VFHDISPMLCQITCMRNSYHVASCVWFTQSHITHGTAFRPFLSERLPSLLISCFPSMIFSQLLCLKQELQQQLLPVADVSLLMSTFKKVTESLSSHSGWERSHLSYVQGLFGLSFRIGVGFTVSCRLPRRETSIKGLQQISPSATLNIISFEDNCRAVVRRGVYYKYRPQSKLLTITVCYKR
jgi:hypothetical protein